MAHLSLWVFVKVKSCSRLRRQVGSVCAHGLQIDQRAG